MQRANRGLSRRLSISMALLMSLLPLGCGGTESGSDQGRAEEKPAASAKIYVVRGVYEGPAFDGAAIQVNHETIDGYMEAMSMAFRLNQADEIQRLQPGDKIEFDYVEDGLKSYVKEIRILEPSTPLELAQE